MGEKELQKKSYTGKEISGGKKEKRGKKGG